MPRAGPRSSHILAEDPLARALHADLLCFGFDGQRVEVPIGRPGVRPLHSVGAARLLPAPAAMNNNQVTERALRKTAQRAVGLAVVREDLAAAVKNHPPQPTLF